MGPMKFDLKRVSVGLKTKENNRLFNRKVAGFYIRAKRNFCKYTDSVMHICFALLLRKYA
jgi:hypothetical protein